MSDKPIWELLAEDAPAPAARTPRRKRHAWREVVQYAAQRGGGVVHHVESDGIDYRCTCQSFRIQKKGFCKHTTQAQADGF